jgi:hypothetical protein
VCSVYLHVSENFFFLSCSTCPFAWLLSVSNLEPFLFCFVLFFCFFLLWRRV